MSQIMKTNWLQENKLTLVLTFWTIAGFTNAYAGFTGRFTEFWHISDPGLNSMVFMFGLIIGGMTLSYLVIGKMGE